MKYGDLLLVFFGIILLMSIGYAAGVNLSTWYLPLILFISFIFLYYELKIKK